MILSLSFSLSPSLTLRVHGMCANVVRVVRAKGKLEQAMHQIQISGSHKLMND